MFVAIYLGFFQWIIFTVRLCRALPQAGTKQIPRRFVIFVLVWALTFVLTLVHAIGFILDELLFWRYRDIDVKATFIVGVPRSGTTWLHRVMAADKGFTTLTLWECVLAPSICERYVYRALGFLLSPVGRVLGLVLAKLMGGFDNIHKLRLNEPEEDFLLLAPLHACFLWVLLCPRDQHYWRLGYFDQRVEKHQRQAFTHFYYRCVQKHLFFHGAHKRLLSKNPSFTPMLESLQQQFPGASFIACVRKPKEVVPSQLSSLAPAMRALGFCTLDAQFCHDIQNMLKHYYQQIAEKRQSHALMIVDVVELCDHLEEVVRAIYGGSGQPLGDEFAEALKVLADQGRHYRSGHKYDLGQFYITEDQLDKAYKGCWPLDTLMTKSKQK